MFSAIAQLIQAEAPEGFSAEARAAATDGASTEGAFAELLAVLQAASSDAADTGAELLGESPSPEAEVPVEEADAEAADPAAVTDDTSETDSVSASSASVVAGASTQSAQSVQAAQPAETALVSDVPEAPSSDAPKLPVQAAKLPGLATASVESEASEAAGKVVALQAVADPDVEAEAKLVAAVKPDAPPDDGAEALQKALPETALDSEAELPASVVLAKAAGKSRFAAFLERGEAKATPVAKPPEPELAAPPKVEGSVATTKAFSMVEAKAEDPPETVAAKAVAPVAKHVEPKVAATEAEPVEEAETVDEAPPRRSLFASTSRRVAADGGQEQLREADTFRAVESQRGRPATVREMLHLNAAVESSVDAPDVESVVKTEPVTGVERASSSLRGEALRGQAEVPDTPETTPQRTTLPEVGKTTLRGVRYLIANGERTITIKLVPESLGELRLDVISRGDEVSVRMASANPMVRDVLEGQMAGLREQLSRDGIELKQIDVGSDMNGNGDRGQQASRETGSETARTFARLARSMPGRGLASQEKTPMVYRPPQSLQQSGLNVFA